MIRKIQFNPSKTYATEYNAEVALAKKGFYDLRYFVVKNEQGRYFPVFVGQEAVQRGVHFHFHVVG